jgi:hypothetical protein
MTGWIDTQEWQRGDYLPLVEELYPEAVATAPDGKLEVRSLLPVPNRVITEHALATLYFGWGSGDAFESWSGLFGMGPLGFARIGQNPEAITAALAYQKFAPAPKELEHPSLVRSLAELLAEALGPPRGPDRPGREDREHYMRSGLFDEAEMKKIDDDRPAKIQPHDRAEWAALRPRLAPIAGEILDDRYRVRFCRMDARGGGRVELANYTVDIARDGYGISSTSEVIGALACAARTRSKGTTIRP